ncbi:MAG TPA: quinone oxidoreductase [Myxococcaceae bacterium]|nr:quinone oxidoreductase [Myxococcaceae bacterium]
MPYAIRVHRTGGPEVLSWEEIDLGRPGPGQVRLRQRAVGLNFIDVYHRTAVYPLPTPFVVGQEGAGEVVEVGPGVTELRSGDRVAYAGLMGAYAEERLATADRLVKLPNGISFETAAAMMLKGMTAEYLLRRTRPLSAGETILFHAAAGGVGLIACQWARALGATVIGTVGSRQKAELARSHGCHHVIVTSEEDFVKRVKEITSGRGVPVVYDSVGQATWQGSLDCLRPRGLFVLFGQSSGKVPPIDAGILNQKGSLFLTRPSLGAYTATRAELLESAGALFERVLSGEVRIEVNQRYPLAEAAQAQRDLEARKTTGSTVLIVG